MRCRFCGMDMLYAQNNRRETCSPPFDVQRHVFDGSHPADVLEARTARQLAPGVYDVALDSTGKPDMTTARPHVRPITEPGPIRFVPNAIGPQAATIREVLHEMRLESDDLYLHRGIHYLMAAPDDVLVLLRKKLRE